MPSPDETSEVYTPQPERPEHHTEQVTDPDQAAYHQKIAAVGKEIGYEGPACQSFYELIMRQTGGLPEINTIRKTISAMHDAGFLTDEFSSEHLNIFYEITDVKRVPNAESIPLHELVTETAAEDSVRWGDADKLWRNVATIYNLNEETTFKSLEDAIKAEGQANQGKTAASRQYTSPLKSSGDMINPQQYDYSNDSYGKGVNW